MPYLQAFAAAFLLLSASPAAVADPIDPDVAAYRAELARQCPAKHLEWLNPGWLADPIGTFLEHATPAQRAEYERIYQSYCAHVDAGASCGNFAAIKAAARFHMTARQAADVCREAVVCADWYDCKATTR